MASGASVLLLGLVAAYLVEGPGRAVGIKIQEERFASDRQVGARAHGEMRDDDTPSSSACSGCWLDLTGPAAAPAEDIEPAATASFALTGSTPRSAFAVFSFVHVGHNVEQALAQFDQRVLPSRRSWGREVPEFTMIATHSATAQTVLDQRGCTRAPVSYADHAFAEWSCPAGDAPEFRYLLVKCHTAKQMRKLAKGKLDRAQMNAFEHEVSTSPQFYRDQACKHDRAIEYMMSVNPNAFTDVQWAGMGTDEVGFQADLLLDFLGHYDAKRPLVLNPAAGQDGASGPVSRGRECNAAIPERFTGTILSRGVLEKVQDDAKAEALETLTYTFGGAQGTVLGLLLWMHDAEYVPVAQAQGTSEELGAGPSEDAQELIAVAHKLRTPADHTAQTDQLYPPAKRLPGPRYKDSRHAQGGRDLLALSTETCKAH